jgi:hypothetical protein
VVLDTLDNTIQDELQMYENNYKTLNLITTALGRNMYDRVAHLETAHDVWFQLYNTYEGSSEIKFSRRDTYNKQYQTFSQKHGESLDDCFARFESIVSSLCSCGPLASSDSECAKQLLIASLKMRDYRASTVMKMNHYFYLHHHLSRFLLPHLKQRLLRLPPPPQQQWRRHGLRGRSSLSQELPFTFRRHIHLSRS